MCQIYVYVYVRMQRLNGTWLLIITGRRTQHLRCLSAATKSHWESKLDKPWEQNLLRMCRVPSCWFCIGWTRTECGRTNGLIHHLACYQLLPWATAGAYLRWATYSTTFSPRQTSKHERTQTHQRCLLGGLSDDCLQTGQPITSCFGQFLLLFWILFFVGFFRLMKHPSEHQLVPGASLEACWKCSSLFPTQWKWQRSTLITYSLCDSQITRNHSCGFSLTHLKRPGIQRVQANLQEITKFIEAKAPWRGRRGSPGAGVGSEADLTDGRGRNQKLRAGSVKHPTRWPELPGSPRTELPLCHSLGRRARLPKSYRQK